MLSYFRQLENWIFEVLRWPHHGVDYLSEKIKEPLHTIHQQLENIVRITNLAQFNCLSFYHLDAKFVDSATRIARREAENRGLTVLPDVDDRQLQQIQISLLHYTDMYV